MPQYVEKISSQPIYIIGNSHLICFLDGISNWRKSITVSAADTRQEYSEAFQGYTQLQHSPALQRLTTHPNYDFFQDSQVCLDTVVLGSNNIVHKYTNEKGGRMIRPGDVLNKFINELPANAIVISFLFGNEHTAGSLIRTPVHQPHYDFYCPDTADLTPSKYQPIDRQMVNRHIARWTHLVQLATQWILQKAPHVQLYHVLPPPPLRHPQKVLHQEIFAQKIAEFGFLEAEIRLKWYRAYCRSMQKELGEKGVDTIKAPSEAFDYDGYLLPALAEGLTHANATYGRMLASNIQQEIQGRPKSHAPL